MAWQQPKTNWDTHPKAIEPEDMNRIEGNILAVREQTEIPLRLEVVSSFPGHVPGRAVYHTGNKKAYVSDGSIWVPIGIEGDAEAKHVLEGKGFSSQIAGAGITGTMPNRGSVTITPGTTDQTIPEGYHDGSGKVRGVPNLLPSNVKILILGKSRLVDFSGHTLRVDSANERQYLKVDDGVRYAYTSNRIDLTNYNRIVGCGYHSYSSWASSHRIYASTTPSGYEHSVTFKESDMKVVILDCSELTGNYYVGIRTSSGGSVSGYIYFLYLI